MKLKDFTVDNLRVKAFDTRANMGADAAAEAAIYLKELLANKDEVNAVFAAAPSQDDFLASLVATEGIEWNRVNAFHMDEYVGLPSTAPQGFGNFLKERIFSKLPFKSVNYIGSEGKPEELVARYDALLASNHIDVVFMGIGENGHIAFNDPHVADFNDPARIKKVDLDLKCRMQQVHDGCFVNLDQVPEYALTLTVPTLFSADRLFCIVPAATKADAVKLTVEGEIGEHCPATILRRHANATMYLDADSAKHIL